jgi:plastocyanin
MTRTLDSLIHSIRNMTLGQFWVAVWALCSTLLMPAVLYAQTIHEVEVGDGFFNPQTLTIDAGDTVRWVNAAGGLRHDVVSEDGSWTPSILANEFIFEVVFPDEGEFGYFCTPHRDIGMTGTITVEASAAFTINAGLNDAWYNPLTDGQGFFVTVFPDIEIVFLAWFTFDTELPPMDATANPGYAGHRWLTAIGSYVDNQAVMNINITSGGIFDSDTDVENVEDGTIILTFEDCNSGTVEYDIPSINRQGTVPIQRIANDNIALCEALQAD